jgi:hypothetical protein
MIFALFSGVLQVQFREGILKPSEFPVQVWFFWALLAALFFLVVSIQGNRHRLQIFFRSMVHRPMLLEYVEDYDRRGFPSDWGLFLAGFSTAPVWVAWWISGGLDWAPLTITLIGMCSVIFKALLVEQLGRLFSFKMLARAHNAVFYQYLFWIGMLALLVLFFFNIQWVQMSNLNPRLLLILMLGGFVLYFIRLSSVLWFSTRTFGVYYILYLCTLELIPFFLFLRWSGFLS